MVAMTPMFISTLMTSVALMAIFWASSATVTVSPMLTSRTTGAVGISKPCRPSAAAQSHVAAVPHARAHGAPRPHEHVVRRRAGLPLAPSCAPLPLPRGGGPRPRGARAHGAPPPGARPHGARPLQLHDASDQA